MGDRDDKLRGRARLASDLATVDLHGEKKAEPSPSSAFDRPADRFETVGEIGRGGMGRVDDAFDRTLGRPVAIKHMLAQSGLDFARFEREARITARLEHPGIVPVHEAGRSIDGTPYYVMRRVDGQPLAQLVVDKPLEERLKLIPNLLAACDAAGYAHARGIVHRDIKPTNILVGPFGETLLIDWGLARALDEADQAEIATSPSDQNLTRAGTVAGTPGFMAPEQARAETVDARADVFALGATLFFVLSGQLPWGSTSATELVTLVGTGQEPDWTRLPSQVPADLRAVLEKAMAIDPALRYPDAGALAADLRRFTLGNLVAAYEYGPIAKLVLYARKHRAAFGVGVVALAVIALVAVISIRRIVAERDGAEEARSLAEARQRDATAMADELLVQHARELAETDPAAAIAALRRLRPESNRWNDAWAAAVMAWQRGVPFGFAATTSADAGLTQISMSPDNRHVLLANHRRGDLSLFDIVARTRRELAHGLGSLGGAVWLDEHRIACVLVTEQALGFVDVTSGAITRKSHLVSGLYGVGNGRIWVELDNHTVLEYTDPAQPPRTLMDHVDEIFVASDLRSAVVRRGTNIEAWVEGAVTPLPLHRSLWTAVIHGGLVATVDAEEVSAWKLEQGRAVEYGHWPRDKVAHVRVIDGMPVVITPGGVHALTPGGVLELEREVPESMWDSSQGELFAMHDGRLIVYDGDGRFELGKRPTAVLRMAQSQDQRWLVALATTGDLLVWDLARVRPRRVHVSRLEQPLLLYRGKVWLSEVGFGSRTVDLATGKSERLLDDVPPGDWTYAASHGELMAVANFRIGHIAIYDAARKRSFTLTGIVSASEYNHGLLFADADGQLLRWRTGETKLLPIMKLSVAPDLLAAFGSNVLARLTETELAHIDTDTQRITRITMPRTITSFAIDLRGDSWLVSGGKLYQWRVGSAPTEIETPGLADDIVPILGGLAVHCPTAIVVIRGKERRVIALASRAINRGSFENALVFETPHAEVGVLDLESGSSVLFPQPKPLGGMIAGDETQVVYRDNSLSANDAALLVWTLDVPHDRVALRAWLGSITNAKSFPNNDTVVYP